MVTIYNFRMKIMPEYCLAQSSQSCLASDLSPDCVPFRAGRTKS